MMVDPPRMSVESFTVRSKVLSVLVVYRKCPTLESSNAQRNPAT